MEVGQVLLFLVVGLTSVLSAPPMRPKMGPCIGMDCMHGVLMHGDKEAGEDHAAQDTYERLQDQDRVRQEGKNTGPTMSIDQLMHDSKEDANHAHAQAHEVGPEAKKDIKPQDAMEALHGVLMHGDKEQGVGHKRQDAEAKNNGNIVKGNIGPEDAMENLHGVLMHGDESQGKDHKHEDEQKTKEYEGRNKDKGHQGPCQGMDCMHGVMMHGDEEQGKQHEHKQPELKFAGKKSGVSDPENLMHGAGEEHVHTEGNKAPEDPSKKGVPSVGDMHAAIHGDLNAQMVNTKMGEAHDSDKDDYLRWKEEDDTDVKDKSTWGFSLPFISDTLMDIDLMKRRYLAKFWGTEEDAVAYEGVDHKRKLDARAGMEDSASDMRHDVDMVGNTAALNEGHVHQTGDSGSSYTSHDES